jgi:hypothetical protein
MQNEKFGGADLDYIRDHHHEETAEMIYGVFEDSKNAFTIPLVRDASLVESIVLGRVCKLRMAEYTIRYGNSL